MCHYANHLLIILNSLLFLLTPIGLVIHLALNQKMTSAKKKRLGYIYGGIWLTAFLAYLIIFANCST